MDRTMIDQLVPVISKLCELKIESSIAFQSENDLVAKVMDGLVHLESHYSLFDDLALPSAIEKRVSEILSTTSDQEAEQSQLLKDEFLDMANTNVNSLLSSPEDLLSIAYQTPQRKRPRTGGTNHYFSFNFDGLAPLGILSEVIDDLSNDETIPHGLQKLFEFDTSDLLEHPQWPQFVEKLDFFMLQPDFISRYFELLSACYFRLLQAFPMGTMQQDDTLRLSVLLLERYTLTPKTETAMTPKTEKLILMNLFRFILQTFTPIVRYWQGEMYDQLFFQLVRLLTQEKLVSFFLQNVEIMNNFKLLLKKVRPFVLFITAMETNLLGTLKSQISRFLSSSAEGRLRCLLSLFAVYKLVWQCVSCFSSGSSVDSSRGEKSRVFIPGTNKLFSCSNGNETAFSQVIYQPHKDADEMESQIQTMIISLLTTHPQQLFEDDAILLDEIINFARHSQQYLSQVLPLLFANSSTRLEHTLTRLFADDIEALTLLDDHSLNTCINSMMPTLNNQQIIASLCITCLARPSLTTYAVTLLHSKFNWAEIVQYNGLQLIRKVYEVLIINPSQTQQNEVDMILTALLNLNDTAQVDGIIIVMHDLIASYIILTQPNISSALSSFLRQLILTASSLTGALESSGDDTSRDDTTDIIWVCRQLILTLSTTNNNDRTRLFLQSEDIQSVILALDGLEESIDLIHSRHDRVVACPPTTHNLDEMMEWDTLIHDSRIPHKPLQLLASPLTAVSAAYVAVNQQAEELLVKYFIIDYPMPLTPQSPDLIKQTLVQAQSSSQWTKHVKWFYLSLLRSTVINSVGSGEEEIQAVLDLVHNIQQASIYTSSDLLLIRSIMQSYQHGRYYRYYEHKAECSIIALSQMIVSGWFMPFVSVDDAGLIAMAVLNESSSLMILAVCAVLILFARFADEQRQRWKGLETITHHMLISNKVWSLMELIAVTRELLQEELCSYCND